MERSVELARLTEQLHATEVELEYAKGPAAEAVATERAEELIQVTDKLQRAELEAQERGSAQTPHGAAAALQFDTKLGMQLEEMLRLADLHCGEDRRPAVK